jgi:predicted DNA-binding transcriptional regulator YafY
MRARIRSVGSRHAGVRQALLALLPRANERALPTPALHVALREHGLSVTPRAVQAQLRRMESDGLVSAIERQKPTQWRLRDGVVGARFDPLVGLAALLAKEASGRHLAPEAAGVLHEALDAALHEAGPVHGERWATRVRACASPVALAPSPVRPAVLRAALEALLRDRLVAIETGAPADEGGAFVLPVGLVLRPGLWTLLLRDGSERIVPVPLHRVRELRIGEAAPAQRGRFDLDAYLAARSAIGDLPDHAEAVLAFDDDLVPLGDGAWMARATDARTVVRTRDPDWPQLVAFLVDCGDGAEVLAPRELHEAVAASKRAAEGGATSVTAGPMRRGSRAAR